jgi:predicted nucleic-acid-binding Zn-ribbon protein
MATWLVCKECGVKEWLQPHTPLTHCPKCRAPRFAEDDAGQPMVLWSAPLDPNVWA